MIGRSGAHVVTAESGFFVNAFSPRRRCIVGAVDATPAQVVLAAGLEAALKALYPCIQMERDMWLLLVCCLVISSNSHEAIPILSRQQIA